MPLNPVKIGTAADNGTGDKLRIAFQKLNVNDTYLKGYMDALLQGWKWKNKVDIATTANITLTGEQTIDGVLTSSSRVLVKDQTLATENGIYVSGAGAWTRSLDADTGDKLVNATVSVNVINANEDRNWTCNVTSITLGTTDIIFVPFIGGTGVDQGTFDAAIQLINDELDLLEARIAANETNIAGKENSLGNPTIDGQVLSSTIAGVRSWKTADQQVSFVTTVPTTGVINIIYAESSTNSLKIWNGTAYELYGGGGVDVEVNIQYEKVWRTGDSQIFPVTDSSKTLNVYANGDWLSRERRSEDLIIGESYKILIVGDTDFTALGASANTVGTVFTATGASLDGKTGRVESEWKVNDATSIIVLIPLDDKDNISIVSSSTAAPGSSYDDTALTLIAKTDVISYALSSPSADLVAGDADSFIAPYSFTLNTYFAGVSEAPTGSALVVGLKKNTVSVTSSNAIIDATETTSLTGTDPTITTQSFLKGDLITPTIQQVGSLTTGKSLKIYLEITKL